MQIQHHLSVAHTVTRLLDSQFSLFGKKFGLDPLLGLIPGFGDVVSLSLSFYILWIAIQMRISMNVIAQMLINILFDFLIGLLPVVGDFSDFVYKANTKNLALLKKSQTAPVIEGYIV